jgi:hypothetical protein
MPLRKLSHKYGATRTKREGKSFPSKLEANCFSALQSLKNSGKLLFFLCQVPVDIGAGLTHRVDFFAFSETDCWFIEAKGRDLEAGRMRRQLAQEILGVEIHVVHDPKEIYAIIQ